MMYSCRRSISSDLKSVKILIDEILSDLNSVIKIEEILFDIRLILNELVINSVVHGNQLDENRFINVCIEADESSISIFVKDEG